MANLEQRGAMLKRGSAVLLVVAAACGERGGERKGNSVVAPASATAAAPAAAAQAFEAVPAAPPQGEMAATPALDGGYGPLPPQPPLPADAGTLPPAAKADRYAGRWAETIALCGLKDVWFSDMWMGDRSHSCRLAEMRRTRAGGYSGIAWCTDRNAPPGQLDVGRRIELSFDEKTQRMRMEGGPFASPALVYCGTSAE